MVLLLLLASIWLGTAVDTGKDVFENHAVPEVLDVSLEKGSDPATDVMGSLPVDPSPVSAAHEVQDVSLEKGSDPAPEVLGSQPVDPSPVSAAHEVQDVSLEKGSDPAPDVMGSQPVDSSPVSAVPEVQDISVKKGSDPATDVSGGQPVNPSPNSWLGKTFDTTAEVLANNGVCNSPTHKHFRGKSLGYVTPWNSQGLEAAVKYAAKFDYMSPVWHQLKIRDQLEILGERDPDFLIQITVANPSIKLVPRLMLEDTLPADYAAFLEDDGTTQAFAVRLAEFVESQGYHGIVLEVWAHGLELFRELSDRTEFRALQTRMLKAVGRQFKRRKLLLILPVPPLKVLYRSDFDGSEFLELAEYVSFFHIMTNDFSRSIAGPNSPLFWIENCLSHFKDKLDFSELDEEEADAIYSKYTNKLLISIPFYGYHFKPVPSSKSYATHESEAIYGADYLSLLESQRPELTWDQRFAETYFTLKDNSVVYYPSTKFIKSRLDFAAAQGVGIAVWELGQGLEYFYDLL
jgi:chitinase domain-containing protein 1